MGSGATVVVGNQQSCFMQNRRQNSNTYGHTAYEGYFLALLASAQLQAASGRHGQLKSGLPSHTTTIAPFIHLVWPNQSLKRSANGMPPGPGLKYSVHFLSPGPGGIPLSPA